MRNMKISTKLLAGFGLMAVLAALIAWTGVISIRSVAQADNLLYEVNTIPLGDMQIISAGMDRMRYYLLAGSSSKTASEAQQHLASADRLLEELKEPLDRFTKAVERDPKQARAIEKWKDARAIWAPYRNQVIGLIKAGQYDQARQILMSPAAQQAGDGLVQASTALTKVGLASAKDRANMNVRTTNSATTWMLLLLAIGVAGAIGMGLFMSRAIGGPLSALTRAANQMADGDTDIAIEVAESRDEVGQLADAIRRVTAGEATMAQTAQRLASGDLSIAVQPRSSKDMLAQSMQQVLQTIKGLVGEMNALSAAAKREQFDTRGNVAQFQGAYAEVVQGVNETLDTVVEKIFWYESMLDAIPFPISVTDNEMNWTFINKPVEDMLSIKRKDVLGRHCSNWNANICRTENCGIARLRKGQLMTTFQQMGRDFRVDTAYIRNTRGQQVGHIEVVQDITAMSRVTQYQKEHADRVLQALDGMAAGNLDVSVAVDAADEYTQDTHAAFSRIADNLDRVRTAVARMADDAAMLADAGVNGKLQTRADASEHQGQYRQIIEGFNATLDAVIEPLRIAADLIETVAYGRDFTDITAQMRGDYAAIKENGNAMRETLYGVLGALLQMGEAAERGDLDHRIDSSQFRGRWVDIIESMNKAYATVAEPFQRLIDHADHLSQGIIPPTITRDYKGQLLRAKEAYNTLFQTIRTLVEDATALAEAGVKGQLETRADASKHKGDFRKIVEGVNATLDAVVQPIQELQAVLERVAARDLTARVQGSYQGDFDAIKTATNRAIENLDEGLQQVAIGADQVASASVEISTGSQTLSQSASEQASSLEEISSSLQEMSSMTRQNAANAREATSLAESARHAAERGMESMTRMSEAMNRIKASSDQTARIVKTIDEIAFQTNLLALNAAVEAARAGDAGKGFAVVAEEVRNLAMRSAEAAKNTANLIEESVNNADDGVAINAEVLQHLQEINTQAHKVSEVMAEIAAASEQQTMGIDQVNGAVSQMDQLTQQNAANSEESASAAEELSSQAEEMRSMVAGFALSRSTGARPAHANVRPAAKLHHSGNGKGKPMAARPKPSAVIPLDDTEDAEVLQSF